MNSITKMNKRMAKSFFLLLLFLAQTLGLSAQVRLYLEDFEISKGETKTVSLMLDNDQDATVLEAHIALPDGLVYVPGSEDKTSRVKGRGAEVQASTQTGELVIVETDGTIAAGEGAVITFNVKATTIAEGNKTIYLSGLVVSDSNGDQLNEEEENTANVLVQGLSTCTFGAPEAIEVFVDEEYQIDVTLNNEGVSTLSALQGKLYLPEGLEIVPGEEGKFIYSDRIPAKAEFKFQEFEDYTSFVLSSSQNQAFTGVDGVIFSFKVKASKSLADVTEIALTDLRVANIAGSSRLCNDVTITVTNGTSKQKEADKEAFEEYKGNATELVNAMALEGDSEACLQLIADAKEALAALEFDEEKTLEENETVVIELVAKLAEDLTAQRDAEKLAADKAAFVDFQATAAATADGAALEGDSEACQKIIADAKEAIAALEYDEEMTLEENEAVITAIITAMTEDLLTQRAEEEAAAKKEANEAAYIALKAQYNDLKQSLRDAKNTIKTECASVADQFEEDIEDIEDMLNDANAKLEGAYAAEKLTAESELEGGTLIAEGIVMLVAEAKAAQQLVDNKAEFAEFKITAAATAEAMALESDSETSLQLISNAQLAIAALEYDEELTLEENKALVTAIISNLTTELLAQRAAEQLEADKKAFAEYQLLEATVAEGMAEEGDPAECAELIAAAKLAIASLEYDEEKTLDENKALIDAIIKQLEEALVDARKPKDIYLDTDVTAQFPLDYQGWKGASGYVGWAAPKVTTNDGRETAACEKYEGTCANTGVVFSRTLTGLANGIYTIELYGAAAFTSGRGFDSDLVEGDETAVYLYAETPAGQVKQFIPAHIATDFNGTGIATATLVNVEVTDGTVTLGMYKEKPYTNWHVVQIKGVTARVKAVDALAIAVEAANEVDVTTIPEKLAIEIGETVLAYNKEYTTAEEYEFAIAAIDAVVAKAAPYAPLTAILAKGEEIKANVPEESEAIDNYDAAIADVVAAYDAAAIEDFDAAIAAVKAALPALAKAQTVAGSDMTLCIVNPDIDGNANGWTIDRPFGGNGPLLNDNAFEYWAGNASDRSKASFDYWQEISGLTNGIYTLTAKMYNSTNGEDGAVFAPTAGLYAQAGNAEMFTAVDVDGTDLIEYAVEIEVVDGTLRLGVKNGVTPMAARWFVADNFTLTLKEAKEAPVLDPYEAAMAALEDGGTYRISTEVEGVKYYLNNAGKLADEKEAYTFTFTKVTVSGTLYESGWNLGCKFTNPGLSGGATGDIVNDGSIHVGNNDRNDWERQVFFLNKEGLFAVRSTNANSANWGANTYWDVLPGESVLPEAGYSLEQSFVWNVEAYVDLTELNALLADFRALVENDEAYVEYTAGAKETALNAIEGFESDVYTSAAKVNATMEAVHNAALNFIHGITPIQDIDITKWAIVNPSAYASNAMAEGWEGDNFGTASDGVSEYWNKAAVGFHQTLSLPAGEYELTAIALTRTNMVGTIYAGDYTTEIATVGNDVVNSRAQAAAWFAEGNGVNKLDFALAEDGEMTIGLTTDNTTGDHWTVWQGFSLIMKAQEVVDPYEAALAAIEDEMTYRIVTNVNGTKYYVTEAGGLTSVKDNGGIFTLKKVTGGSYKEYGFKINSGTKRFTNPPLANNVANLTPGAFATTDGDRNDWEAQVLFLSRGKYAIRSCNTAEATSSWGDAGRTYWTWGIENVESEPVPCYTYDQTFAWNFEAVIPINVTYVLYESDGETQVGNPIKKMQESYSEINIPADMAGNFAYDYLTEGEIGAEDCTIKVVRSFKEGVVHAFSDLSNEKAYTIRCDRGALVTKNDYLASTAHSTLKTAEAEEFAVLSYENNYYLYSVKEGKFVTNSGALAEMPTHGVEDAIKMTPNTDPYFMYYFVINGTNNGLNTNGNDPYGYVINTWMNADPGNLYYMVESSDFDATEALEALNGYFHPSYFVTYVVKDANGETLYTSEPAPARLGEKITTLPADYQRPFTTYDEVDITISEKSTTAEFTATWAGPFELSSSFEDAKWYNMTIRSDYYVAMDDTEPYYPKADKELTDPRSQWAFAGDAYNGIVVYNMAAGEGFALTKDGDAAVMREGDYSWDILKNSDGFILREQGTTSNCINQSGGSSGPLKFWGSAASTTDNGSTFRVSEAPEPVIPAVAFIVKANITSGTADAFTIVETGSPLKLAIDVKNLAVNGYKAEELTLKVDMLFAGRFSDKGFAMGTNEIPPYQKAGIELPLADEVTLADDIFGTEYPFIQSIRIMGLSLMKGDEPIAASDEMIVISFIEVYENGAPVGIKAITTDGEKADIYDLSGRKVEKVQRGNVYIINGKKVSIK